ncbi:hypothetical protein BZA77DRAFT_302643 [Pyronema omphalodes]|nr:hypothetical protein BZA77DRAFT_302643 [Pyronema omphalodes]
MRMFVDLGVFVQLRLRLLMFYRLASRCCVSCFLFLASCFFIRFWGCESSFEGCLYIPFDIGLGGLALAVSVVNFFFFCLTKILLCMMYRRAYVALVGIDA